MNKINIGKEIKISMLGIISGTLILTLGEMMLIPLPEKTSFHARNFPDEISLPGWQVSSGNLPQHFNENKLQTIPGKSYKYTQNDSFVDTSIVYGSETLVQAEGAVAEPASATPDPRPETSSKLRLDGAYKLGSIPSKTAPHLPREPRHPSHSSDRPFSASLSVNIQMHYLTAEHDVKTLLKKYTSLPHQSLKVLEREKIGSYGVLIHQDELHLTSCITPQGSSIVSKANFYQSYPAFQLLSERLVFWLLGEKPLVENVCLWSHLSIPLSNSSPEKAYLTLEKVWFSWYEHWHPYLVTIVNSK